MNKKLLILPLGAVLLLAVFVPVYQAQQSGLSATVGMKVNLTVKYHAAHATYADPKLVLEGYSPSCWVGCDGILYTLDPTVHIVNNGIDFIQCKLGGTSSSISCQSADLTQYLSVGASSGHVPAFTDSSCAAQQTADGYSIAAGSITPGSPSGGAATWTVSYTWTDATAGVSSLDLACIQTEGGAGSHIVLYAEGQIGSTSTNIGDTLETIWQITYSSS